MSHNVYYFLGTLLKTEELLHIFSTIDETKEFMNKYFNACIQEPNNSRNRRFETYIIKSKIMCGCDHDLLEEEKEEHIHSLNDVEIIYEEYKADYDAKTLELIVN